MRHFLLYVVTAFLGIVGLQPNAFATASVRQESHTAWTAAGATTVTTPAFGSAVLTGDTIETWVICSCTTTPTGVTDSGSQTYTLRTSVHDNNTGVTIYLYTHVNNSSATALTVTATWGAAETYNGIWAKDITGVSSSPYQTAGGQSQANPGTTTGLISSGNVTPTGQPALISSLSWDSAGNASSIVAGSQTAGSNGWLLSGGTAPTGSSGSQRVTSTSAIAMTYSNSTDGGSADFVTMAAIYTEATATGSPNQHMPLTGVAKVIRPQFKKAA